MNSIKTKAQIFSLSIIVLALLALGYSAYNRFRGILTKEVNQAVVRVASESAEHLGYFIENFVEPLKELADHDDMKSMDWDKQKELLKAQINPFYLNVAVSDLNGRAHYIDGMLLDLSDREYVKNTLNGNIAFSEVIISRVIGEEVIMVGVPIMVGETVQGALLARLDVNFLSGFALARGYEEKGYSYIISDKGTLISSHFMGQSGEEYNLFEIADHKQTYKEFSEFVKGSLNQKNGYGKFQFDDSSVLMGYAPVAGTNWKVYTGIDEDVALQSLVGLRKIMLIGMIVALILCTAATWVFVDWFTKPIIELDRLFSKGALGDLTIRFTTMRKDEIGKMGQSFNRMMDKIKTLTHYDPLTSLLNHNVLQKEVDSLTQEQDEVTHKFSLIMISVDHFSLINEAYGYKIGDAILYEIAKRIKTCSGDINYLYRYKGDEFVLLVKSFQDENEVQEKAEKILISLNEKYYIDGKVIDISVSIGVYISDIETMKEDPLKAVTMAKNYAKYRGGNKIQFFDTEIYGKLFNMRELQADIMNGLKEEQFFLVFQPLFNLNDGKIAEVEALIRWNHPGKGLLFPDQFIDIAEQTGSIIDMDLWVIENACKNYVRWKENNKEAIRMSINISAKTFETPKFIPYLIKMLQMYRVEPSMLQFEITERMVIRNVDESIVKLKHMKEMGIRVAIDDFGSGYSSLSYIVRLPIDSIKIDKSFIQNIRLSKEAKAIVTTIINLCKTLNLKVIAEGIESKSKLDYLKKNLCDMGQGYYFSKPVYLEEIENKYVKNKGKRNRS
ncbi:EAL domain-containing protein [Mobilitalea sibirica]|uniref:EAL domain-containing protein n=1 Tax=Mobilitalea sibirica TaxID=1462919 RepID=A0A8J7HBN5_9FIRM|nr:EAL domain-containing protein [Mobilitalea sibirica]MBH1941855.1 EAL domain-containing protein [Mobilitalea sibirica]